MRSPFIIKNHKNQQKLSEKYLKAFYIL